MYFLYLDDSGSPNNPKESHFVLAGVCVPEESLRWLSSRLELFAQEIDPTNPSTVEFHAAECFRAVESPWKTMVKEKRIEVIKTVLLKLKDAKSNVVIFGCAVHKASFPNQDPVEIAFEDLSSRFDKFLEHRPLDENKQRGMIIIDKSSYELGLQNLAAGFRKSGNRWGNQLRNICEVPMFVDSKASRLIQLADHIAYGIFRRYEQNDLNYFNCFEDRFDEHDGIIQGLVHKQHYKERCTCPACITRK
jgi:hypothetical protein